MSGSLATTARESLEAHVDECAVCRVTLSELGRRLATGATLEKEASHPAIGTFVGRYEIVGELGAGSMGVVFRARDPELGREVALKLVHRQLDEAEAEIVDQRTLREGRMLARIDHPNVVRVFDVGRWRGKVFVAMEHVDGPSICTWLLTPRTRAQIMDVFAQCGRGLAAAHEAGVVHRDFKPDNAVLDEAGRARVTDFGLARTAEQPEEDVTEGDAEVVHRLTRTHGVVGTPAYMAPEQHRGEPSDERADQYAWCIAFVEALAGTRPFRGRTTRELLAAMHGPPALPSGWRLRRVLARGLAFEPANRYSSMRELITELFPARTRSPSVVVGISLATLASIIGVIALTQRGAVDPCAALDAPIARVWNANRSAALVAVFATANKPFANRFATYVTTAADGYAQTWRDARVAVCRAGVQRGEIDATARARSIECLDGRVIELDAVMTRLESGAVDALAAGPQLVDGLGPIDRCATSEHAPALTDIDRARRLTITARFAAARVLGESGKAREAVPLLRELARDLASRGSRFASDAADVLVYLGNQERDTGQPDTARDHLIAALAAAETAHADQIRVRAWLSLAQLRADDYSQVTEARDALRLAAAVLANAGNPAFLMRQYDVTRGLVALAGSETTEAIAAFRSSLDDPSMSVPQRAQRMQLLARGMLAAGDHVGALAQLSAAEKLLTSTLGPDAPPLVYVLNSSMEPLEFLGRVDEAIVRGERAIALFDASYGKTNQRRAALLGNLASMYSSADQLERALSLQQEVIALKLEIPERDRDPTSLAIAYLNLGSTLNNLMRASEAIAPLERARTLFTQSFGPTNPRLANVASGLYTAHDQLGHRAEALANAELAVKLREQNEVPASYLAVSLIQLADALFVDGQRARARAIGERAAAVPLAKSGREAILRAAIDDWMKRHAP